MNLAAIGAVSEVIAAVAVVISLVYLATQIRQATKIARATTRNAIAERAQSLSQDIIDNADMAEIFVKHLNGEELNAVETLRIQGRCYRDMRHWENIYYQVREGLLTDEEWLGFRRNLAALLESFFSCFYFFCCFFFFCCFCFLCCFCFFCSFFFLLLSLPSFCPPCLAVRDHVTR